MTQQLTLKSLSSSALILNDAIFAVGNIIALQYEALQPSYSHYPPKTNDVTGSYTDNISNLKDETKNI